MVKKMPTMGIYVSDDVYGWLMSKGSPSVVARRILEDAMRKEEEEKKKEEKKEEGEERWK